MEMETSSFFYYTPDPSPAGQHGHFLPHPNGHSVSEQSTVTESSSLPYPSALVPPRPSSSQLKTSPRLVHAPIPVNGTLSPAMLKKNTGLLTPSSPTLHGLDGNEICFFPPTPTMENALTPPTSAVNSQWPFDDNCGETVTPLDLQMSEIQEQWRRTPPVTPVYAYPPSLLPSSNSCPSILLSACPSLSPSSEHSLSPELDFCDPRHLTYPTPTPLTPLDCDNDNDMNAMPTLMSEDNESSFLLNPKIEGECAFSFFDGLDEFESDEDLASLLPTTIDTSFLIKKGELSLDESEMFDDEFDVFSDNDSQFEKEIDAILNPEAKPSRRSSAPKAKKQKATKRRITKKVKAEPCDSDIELDNIVLLAKQSGVPEDAVLDIDYMTPTSCRSEKSITPYPSDCSEQSSVATKDAPVVRRGRKQSLTDDPSKTFVCTLCSRRFRRQEHLKRHFRSLHTQDKPFSCGECGKRFSRSDNLSQHARTHGTGAIVMGVLEEADMAEEDGLHVPEEDAVPRSLVFINAAQAGSRIKSVKSEKSSEKKSRRKRKRDE